jgi:ATP-dependent helicase Lhr and Lhr-like helicase
MTNSPVSSSEPVSSGFYLLDERIQRWIWEKGWTSLRDAQERAIPALLGAKRDVIVAAATAAGKTEAAFLPILTHLLAAGSVTGSVLYVSPLKALINDQWGRLEQLCEELEISVVPWHGDIAATKKNRFLKDPRGVLLITPESLEALFVRRGHSMPGLLAGLRYIVVDELHAFIGSERGKQLQSLMHRVEAILQRKVPRVGLSATLGDMVLAADFLRPNADPKPETIVSGSKGQGLKILVRGIEQTPPAAESMAADEKPELEDLVKGGDLGVAAHLYRTLRGANHLVFPNSRRNVELYSDLLRRHCERDKTPNEFWPHHGNLSKDIREQTETALKAGDKPATAICTSTLEMGIDIGAVRSIAQVGPPPSVASLRQRLGRSGRREGESAILWSYCLEAPLEKSSGLPDRIRQGLVQTVAMIQLLLTGWFEPPRTQGLHASTLVQQLLSLIAERGGVTAAVAWRILVETGPFSGMAKPDFVDLLRTLGSNDLIVQTQDGLLLLGTKGERLANHYEFYSAFVSEDEFRILCEGRALGSLPISRPVLPDSRIIFAGRRWRVLDVESDKKTIVVVPDPGGAPPDFEGGGTMVHDRVRQEMRAVLESNEPVVFLDEQGKRLLEEARSYYANAGLANKVLTQDGREMLLLTWLGDWTNDALVLLLDGQGLSAINLGVAVSVPTPEGTVLGALEAIAKTDTFDFTELLAKAKNLAREKWDWALPDAMLRRSYASSHLDLQSAIGYARKLLSGR